ncbi:MAG: preprotein translocase subunit YajC [Phycisphaerales bacterium]
MNSVLSGVLLIGVPAQNESTSAPVKKAATVPGTEQGGTIGAPPVTVPSTAAPGPAPSPAAAPAKPMGLFDSPIFMIMIVMVGFLLLTSIFGGRKEKKRRAELLTSLANGDRVMTMGGIIGTITELRDDELVLRTDEGSNTKIRFTRNAVQQIVKKSGSATVASSTEAKPAKEAVNA